MQIVISAELASTKQLREHRCALHVHPTLGLVAQYVLQPHHALATSATPDQTAACAPPASPASTKSPLVLPRAQTARPARTRQQSARPLPRPVLHVLPVPARRYRAWLLLLVYATSGLQDHSAARALLASPASTKSSLVLPRAQTARPERSRQQSARPLPRRVLDVLPVPARLFPARHSLLARATSGSQASTAARARPALLEPTKTRQVASHAPHVLPVPARQARAWPSQLALAISATQAQTAACAPLASPENTKS